MISDMHLGSVMDHQYLTSFLTLFTSVVMLARSEPRISLTAPINPVDESGILSIHCQVWDLQRGHEVTIIRVLAGDSERLSVDENVLGSVEDRVFVASRQLQDGSVVYFLSIIDASHSDTGEYVCKILSTTGSSDGLPSEAVFIESTYFPPESDPVCSQSNDEKLTLREGEEIELNCSAEKAYPVVSLTWKRNGVDTFLRPTEEVGESRVYSYLKLTPKMSDNNAVYICEVFSVSFPGRTQTCHVGPIQVIPNDDKTSVVSSNTKSPKPPTKVTNHQDNAIQTFNPSDLDIWGDVPEECRDTCASGTPMYYWILATIVAGSLALIFLLVCLSILVKYYSIKTTGDHKHYLPGQLSAEEIYTEVEQKRGQRLYMALDKRDCNLNATLDCHNYIDTNGRRL